MLSRRSVRVKVMQLLYAMSRDEVLTYDIINKRYWQSIEHSYEVLLFSFYNLIQVTRMAVDDATHRKSKHLPTAIDKFFTAVLADNELISSVRDNKELQKIFEKKGFAAVGDRDMYKNVYNEFAKEKSYEEYILKEDRSKEDHLSMLLELYRFCRKNEIFIEMVEDQYTNWKDDKSLVVGAIKKILKSLPLKNVSLIKDFYPDDETVKEYGEELLSTTCKGDTVLMDHIVPMLENWDVDRLAIIDTILLKMATSEFINFSSIPTKVTLNEYVEVAKQYSTVKSKEFVNGVLDKLMKKLTAEGVIAKEGRGLVE